LIQKRHWEKFSAEILVGFSFTKSTIQSVGARILANIDNVMQGIPDGDESEISFLENLKESVSKITKRTLRSIETPNQGSIEVKLEKPQRERGG